MSLSWYSLSSSTKGVFGVFYSAGPAASGIDRTGGPLSGGLTCSACHGGGSGTTSISFVLKNSSNAAVTSYIAGATYTAEFQVTSSFSFKGFQAVALKTGNLQAGSFTTALTTQSTISTLSGRQYAEHLGVSASGTFNFTWVAPIAGTGNVTFFACGNGVNGNGGTSGDLSSAPITNIINEVPPTTISYPTTQVCNDSPNQSVTISGATGGTFSAAPSGLSINPASGQINVASSTPGLYTITYTYAGGTATKTMKINPLFSINNAANICSNDSLFLAGAWRNTAGIYTSNLFSISGCDSIVNTTLSIKQTSSSASTLTICAGDSVLVGGQYISSTGLNTTVILNSLGCDSTISTTLVLNPSYNTNTSLTICQGETVIFNGAALNASGTYLNNGQTTLGCDSISTLILTVTLVNVGIVNSSSFLSAQLAGAVYQWLDCEDNYAVISGETGQIFTPTMSGNYAVRITEQSCSDTSNCEFIVLWGMDEYSLAFVKLFPNPSNGNLSLTFDHEVNGQILLYNLNGKLIFKESVSGEKVFTKFFDLESGTYLIQIQDKDNLIQKLWVVK